MQTPPPPVSILQLWNFVPGVLVAIIQALIAFKLLKVAKFAQRLISKDLKVRKPLVEICGNVFINNKHRVRILIFNMRSEPIKLDFITVAYSNDILDSNEDLKTTLNKHENDSFAPILGVLWNPKGDFQDDDEHSFQEGCRYLYFKDVCEVLVTIPDFDEKARYAFIISTSNGAVIHHGTASNESKNFPTGGERVDIFPKEIQE